MSVQSQIERLTAIKERIRTNLVAQGIVVPADAMLDEMATQILTAVSKPAFQFTFPDPMIGKLRTSKCYAGDRKFDAVMLGDDGEWICSLEFSVIEY